MKFAILALLGVASAANLQQLCGQPQPQICAPAPPCTQPKGSALSIGQAGGKAAVLGAQERAGAYAALGAESAGSTTNIGAQ